MRPSRPDSVNPGNARLVALDLLVRIFNHGQLLSGLIDRHAGLAALTPRDRAFARLITTTVLRRKGQIDDLINRMLHHPLPAKPDALRHILRLGTAQLIFLCVPPHAAIDQTVTLTKRPPLHCFTSLVNAVLRRINRQGAALVAAQDAARLNLPDWLWESWVHAYGLQAARASAQAHLHPPPFDLTFLKPETPESITLRDQLSATASLKAGPLPTGSLRLAASPRSVENVPGYQQGIWQAQDAAAAIPARLILNALKGGRGCHILDLCAAPGGKTAQLAAAGADVTALDRSAQRLERLRANLNRLGLKANIITADALNWTPNHLFDGVLLDAPCSATGTLRRRPDVTWRKTPQLAQARTALQDALLDQAVHLVKPGGFLVYAVCSLQPEEGIERVNHLLATRADFTRRPISATEVGDPNFITPEGDLLTLPGQWAEQGGIDGFQAARLVKKTS